MIALERAAREYLRRGWSLIPVTGKLPALRSWRRWQCERPTAHQLADWFSRPGVSGVALVCGPVSSGLTVCDFDDSAAYGAWSAAHPDLSSTLPTVRSRRGFHLYFRSALNRIVKLTDLAGRHLGELRGVGYVLAPPSKHPDGGCYRWLRPLPEGPLPELDPVAAGLVPQSAIGHATEITERTETTEDNRSHGGGGCAIHSTEIEKLIRAHLPAGPGQRNRRIFELARALKGLSEYADADPRDLRPIIEEWHKLALPTIRTQALDESRLDFMRAWRAVRFPAGHGPIETAMRQALDGPLPPVAAQYEQARLKRLVGLCSVLAGRSETGIFYLSARTAGRLVGVEYKTAWRWLQLMELDGVLTVAVRGTSGPGGRATRYFFAGKDAQGGER